MWCVKALNLFKRDFAATANNEKPDNDADQASHSDVQNCSHCFVLFKISYQHCSKQSVSCLVVNKMASVTQGHPWTQITKSILIFFETQWSRFIQIALS